jgi:polyphosphate kinase 2 (PPK2 family)
MKSKSGKARAEQSQVDIEQAQTNAVQTPETLKQEKLRRNEYAAALAGLHVELVKLQQWVVHRGLKVCVVFEGRDGAGKGGTIKAITERVSPRVFRVVALPAPTDREKSQMYTQRYMAHFPAAGEVAIFDRSWYNRAGVERVMGFCTEQQVERFLTMFAATDTEFAPWHVARSDDKKRARLNIITHLLGQIPYEDVPRDKVELPRRQKPHDYREPDYPFKLIAERY